MTTQYTVFYTPTHLQCRSYISCAEARLDGLGLCLFPRSLLQLSPQPGLVRWPKILSAELPSSSIACRPEMIRHSHCNIPSSMGNPTSQVPQSSPRLRIGLVGSWAAGGEIVFAKQNLVYDPKVSEFSAYPLIVLCHRNYMWSLHRFQFPSSWQGSSIWGWRDHFQIFC